MIQQQERSSWTSGGERRWCINIGSDYAVFEAVHGTAPDIAGQGIANPTALLLSAVLMLRHLGESTAAERIENGVRRVLGAGRCTTRDLGGLSSTEEYVGAVIRELQNLSNNQGGDPSSSVSGRVS